MLTVTALAGAREVDADVFTLLDRETSGLMDAWVMIRQGSGGVITAGTAVIRAERALNEALGSETGHLPPEVSESWRSYLKAAADCLFTFRSVTPAEDPDSAEEALLASFERWTEAGEDFMHSVESTR